MPGLSAYETAMASVASECQPCYSGGVFVGWDYASVKDVLRWRGLSVRAHVRQIMEIGRYLSLDAKRFRSALAEVSGMDDVAAKLIAAFGG